MDDFKKINEAAVAKLESFVKEKLGLDLDLIEKSSDDIDLLEATASSSLIGIDGEVLLSIDSFFAAKFLGFLGLPVKEPLTLEYKQEAAKEFLNIILGNIIKKIETERSLNFETIKNIDKFHIHTSTTFIFDKVHSGEGVLKLIFIKRGE